MFANGVGRPLCLNNLTNRCIQPRLEFCQHCGQPRAGHKAEHGFKRDESRIASLGTGGMLSVVGWRPTCTALGSQTRRYRPSCGTLT